MMTTLVFAYIYSFLWILGIGLLWNDFRKLSPTQQKFYEPNIFPIPAILFVLAISRIIAEYI